MERYLFLVSNAVKKPFIEVTIQYGTNENRQENFESLYKIHFLMTCGVILSMILYNEMGKGIVSCSVFDNGGKLDKNVKMRQLILFWNNVYL